MKYKKVVLRGAPTFFLATAVLMSVAVVAFAHGPAFNGAGTSQVNCPNNYHGTRADMMKAKLKLTDEQQVLLDEMHQAYMDYGNKKCPDGITPKCMRSREQMRSMLLFRAELAAQNPDFLAVADKIKDEYHGDYKAEFDRAVDARAAFMASLTPEQRATLMKMKFHGMPHGSHARPCSAMK